MKKILYCLVAIGMMALFGCGGDTNTNSVTNPNANTFTPKGTVSGVLRDAVTLQPLAGAVVHIMDKTATTDSTGIFTIKDVPAIAGTGSEDDVTNDAYPVVIDMKGVNDKIKVGALYPSVVYDAVTVTYTSLGETSSDSGIGTNHDTPVDGFVANMTPLAGRLDANLKIQVTNANLVAQTGATVYLYTEEGSTGNTNTAAGNVGHLVATATTDSTGFVTFANIEAHRDFVVRAVSADGNSDGWYEDIITSPADGLTDVYAAQGGSTSYYGNFPTHSVIIGSVDKTAPFITSVSGVANLADIAVPNDALTITFNFSEPLRNNQYMKNTTAETSVLGGIYQDVYVNYDGPKAGNLPYSVATVLDANGHVTAITVSILAADMTGQSRYTVDITDVTDNANCEDVAGNDCVVNSRSKVQFTTAGGFNVAAPAISKSNVTGSIAVNWVPVANAVSYNVYVKMNGFTGYELVSNQTSTEFNMIDAFNWFNGEGYPYGYTNGATYDVKVVAVNSKGSESAFSNVLNFSDVQPAAPAGLALRAVGAGETPTVLDWSAVPGTSYYNVYVEAVVNGVGQGYGAPVATTDVPTFDVAGSLGYGDLVSNFTYFNYDAFASAQFTVTYNVKVTAVDMFGYEGLAAGPVSVSQKTAPKATWYYNSGDDISVAAGAGIGNSATLAGTIWVDFDQNMVYTDLISGANWQFIFAGATTATVTQAFGGTQGAITATSSTATVPWQVTTNSTGSVAAGAVTLSCAAKSVGGALAVAGGF